MIKNILILIIVCALLGISQAHSQTSFEYLKDGETSSGMQQMFYKNKVLNVGNYTYICGATINGSGNYDMLLSKIDALADTLMWSVSYNGGYDGDDYAADLAVDGSSNIIIVGTTQVGTMNYDAITVKYNSSGVQQWATAYAGAAGAPDGLTTVLLDGADIYVAGGAVVSALQLTDILCIKYNSSGTQQWGTTWNSSAANLQDAAAAIRITTGYVTVVGATQEAISPVIWKTASVNFNSSTGAFNSSTITGGTVSEFSEVKDIAVDNSGNIYVCGTKVVSGQGKNIHVVKYDSNLTEVWYYTKNGTADDEGMGIKLSGSDVFISGYISVTGEGRNVYAAKLAQSNGAVAWEINHHLAGADDEATGLQLDGSGDLIVPCTVDRNNTKDIGLLKLNKTNGNIITSTYYNSEYNRNEYARDIAVNPANSDVYISAQVQVNDSTFESRIIKWIFRQVTVPVPSDAYSSYGGYIPNRTQLRETDSTANRTVLYYNDFNGIATYIDNDKISYQLWIANDTIDIDAYRVDMAFTGGKPNAKVYPFNERNEYINYYLGHMDKPSIRTPLSNVILKHGVYDYTDVLFTSSPTGFRHWFVASDGADPKGDYRMNFTGQTGLDIDSLGNLVIATTIGNITYKKAKAYSMNTTTGALTLLGWQPDYVIHDSTLVGFDSFDEWSGTLVLEVDEDVPVVMSMAPVMNKNMDWSTFVGGSGSEMHNGVDSDNEGNVWYCGHTRSVIVLTTPGQNTGDVFSHNDAHVIHFDWECKVKWITYYGGSNDDTAYDIAIDADGNSYSVGTTKSDDIPYWQNEGIDDNTLGGTMDGFFIKLRNTDGVILIDSYIGGDGDDNAHSIAYRPQNAFFDAAVFIVGDCTNATGFPVEGSGTLNGYDQAHAGNRDGFIMELSPEGNLLWSTFFGSSSNDRIYSVADVGGYPTIVGVTGAAEYSDGDECAAPTDGKFPFCPNNWHQEEFTGAKYFIARFNKSRELIHSTFFGNCNVFSLSDNYHLNSRPKITTYRKPYGIGEKHYFYISGRSL